ncbi:MAG TPA: hypothetical protein VFW33_00560, partial [Gemmataceae bacterium]|nr:hypothetical protein [Gemmataceae bacterium]
MTSRSWIRKLFNRTAQRPARKGQRSVRPSVDVLEDRLAPATFTVNSAQDASGNGSLTLRDAILVENGSIALTSLPSTEQSQVSGALHATGGDTILFAPSLAGGTIKMTTSVSNTSGANNTFGPAAFLVNSQVKIVGSSLYGITIERDSSAAAFRLFTVTSTGNLTLENVTLSGGLARGGNGGSNLSEGGGGGGAGLGGAIYNAGKLTLTADTLTGNVAVGGKGGDGLALGYGGGGGGLAGDGHNGTVNGTGDGAGGADGGGAGGFSTNGANGGFGGGGGGGGYNNFNG